MKTIILESTRKLKLDPKQSIKNAFYNDFTKLMRKYKLPYMGGIDKPENKLEEECVQFIKVVNQQISKTK